MIKFFKSIGRGFVRVVSSKTGKRILFITLGLVIAFFLAYCIFTLMKLNA